ncbi:MAG TPA: nuclear transport factor 2 family protein [Longimicrobiales bacterium]|nr:nuclear transport factor 2 family protein [Longimicrobiales bacterium]
MEAKINEIMDGHVAAHYAQDAVAAAGDYAEDVWFMSDDGVELRTRAVMVSLYEQMYQTIRLVDLTYSPEEVVVCADAAHAVGHYTETIETDGQQSTTRYNYMLFWRLQPDGSWKVSRGTLVAVPPAA